MPRAWWDSPTPELDRDIAKLEHSLGKLEREVTTATLENMRDDFIIEAMVVLGELTHLRNERKWTT